MMTGHAHVDDEEEENAGSDDDDVLPTPCMPHADLTDPPSL